MCSKEVQEVQRARRPQGPLPKSVAPDQSGRQFPSLSVPTVLDYPSKSCETRQAITAPTAGVDRNADAGG